MRLGRYSGYGLSLKSYSWIDNIISDNNLSLNLYIYYLSQDYNFGWSEISEMLGNS